MIAAGQPATVGAYLDRWRQLAGNAPFPDCLRGYAELRSDRLHADELRARGGPASGDALHGFVLVDVGGVKRKNPTHAGRGRETDFYYPESYI